MVKTQKHDRLAKNQMMLIVPRCKHVNVYEVVSLDEVVEGVVLIVIVHLELLYLSSHIFIFSNDHY